MAWKKKRILFHVFLCYVVSTMILSGIAVAGNTEYEIKAAYLYQVTKFIQWPDDQFSNQDAPIRICVLGDSPFGKLLDGLSEKTSQNRKLTVEHLPSMQKLSHCQVIYISRSEKKGLMKILRKTEHLPILTISDIDKFAQRGGIIALTTKNNRVRLMINYNASKKAAIKLSSKLLEVATLVGDDDRKMIP